MMMMMKSVKIRFFFKAIPADIFPEMKVDIITVTDFDQHCRIICRNESV